jgi:hypothetical protein
LEHPLAFRSSEVVFTVENIGQPAFDTSRSTLKIEENNSLDKTPTSRGPYGDGEALQKQIRWRSSDSKEISGYIVKPAKIEKKSPVLVFIHGGPQVH